MLALVILVVSVSDFVTLFLVDRLALFLVLGLVLGFVEGVALRLKKIQIRKSDMFRNWGVDCHLLLVVGVALLFVLGLVVRVALKLQKMETLLFDSNRENEQVPNFRWPKMLLSSDSEKRTRNLAFLFRYE